MARAWETVHHETIPYDMQLRMAMINANIAIARWQGGAPQTERDVSSLQRAAQYLTGQQDVEPTARHLKSEHEYRLALYAWDALNVPTNASKDNVQVLLGRAAATLDNLAAGNQPESWEVDFADMVADGLHDVAVNDL